MFAATTSEKVAKVYDVRQDFHLLATLVGHTMWVWDCVFTADSGHLMTGEWLAALFCCFLFVCLFVVICCIFVLDVYGVWSVSISFQACLHTAIFSPTAYSFLSLHTLPCVCMRECVYAQTHAQTVIDSLVRQNTADVVHGNFSVRAGAERTPASRHLGCAERHAVVRCVCTHKTHTHACTHMHAPTLTHTFASGLSLCAMHQILNGCCVYKRA